MNIAFINGFAWENSTKADVLEGLLQELIGLET